MGIGFVENMIRRKVLKTLLFPLCIILVLGLCLYLYSTEGMFSIPTVLHLHGMDYANEWLNKLAKNWWLQATTTVDLTVTMQDVSDVSFETEIGSKRYYYISFNMGDQRMFLSMDQKELDHFQAHETYTIKGILAVNHSLLEEAYIKDRASYGFSKEESRSSLFPYTIKAGEGMTSFFRSVSYVPLVLLLVLLILSFILCIFPLLDIKHYFGLRKLQRTFSLEFIFSNIEQQMGDHDPEQGFLVGKDGHVILTRNWIVIDGYWRVRIYLADELLWAFRAAKHMKVGDSVYLGNKCFAAILSKSSLIKIFGNEKQIDGLLEGVSQAYPWILVGYTPGRCGDWENDFQKIDRKARQKKQSIGFHELSA